MANTQHEANAPYTTAPVRLSVLEGLLVFCTAGLYLPVWFFLASRDIRAVNDDDEITPFLWSLVPLVFIVQPIAFKRFFVYLRRAEKRLNIRSWPSLLDYLWMSLFFSCGLFFAVASVIEVETVYRVIVSVGSVVIFMFLHARLNTLRKRCKTESVAVRRWGYNSLEWLLVLIFTPIILLLFLYTYINSDLHQNLRSKKLLQLEQALEAPQNEEQKENEGSKD
ncbi:hypothetical protein [Salinimonas chungwhensis]|uniref:hypothetical protein n=1 Tax=Salinimonas chungwhensis TaxID=265425 RepID=UPI00035EDCA6|nr:hypothetical protein [Salinimonas chungwhensis]